MSNVLVSGCSYTQSTAWPVTLFPDANITNLGRSGAGNRYISDSITKTIDPSSPPNFVFALFSGVNRSEAIVPANPTVKEFAKVYKYYGTLDESIYFFSGGDKYNQLITGAYNRIKDTSPWPTIGSCDEFLTLPKHIKQECLDSGVLHFNDWDIHQFIHSALMVNYFKNETFLQQQTYRAVIDCQTFLEKHSIPYVFSFFYNPFDYAYAAQFGCLNKQHKLHNQVNWDKFIKVFPFETGIEYNLLSDDDVHLSKEGQIVWSNQIKKKVNKERYINDKTPIWTRFKRNQKKNSV